MIPDFFEIRLTVKVNISFCCVQSLYIKTRIERAVACLNEIFDDISEPLLQEFPKSRMTEILNQNLSDIKHSNGAMRREPKNLCHDASNKQ